MSLDGRSIVNYGLFGVAGRDNSKILKKQIEILGPGITTLIKTLKSGFDFTGQQCINDKQFLDLIEQILCMNPHNRINPLEVLEHPFLN
jgi:hypothetical protein